MSNQNLSVNEITSNLIGFLQKKSIFSKSPQKTKRKQKSIEKSFRENTASNKNLASPRDLKVNIHSPRNQRKIKISNNQETRTERENNDFEIGNLRTLNLQKSETEFNTRFKKQIEIQREKNQAEFSAAESPIRYPKNAKVNQTQRQHRDSLYNETSNMLKMLNPESKARKNQQQDIYEKQRNKPKYQQVQRPNENKNQKSQQTWMGLINHANSFESARIQSQQCLDELSMKLRNQISNVNYKLQIFNSKMNVMISNQLKNLRQKIYEIVQHAFQQSEKTIRHFMSQQQQKFAGQMIAMKEHLSMQFMKVEQMKQELKKPGNTWRRVAGELISTELETTIQADIKTSSNMNVAHWDIGDLGGGKIRALQDLMRDIVKIHR